MKRLIELLLNHDWYYRFSDNPNIYERGKISEVEIKIAIAEVGIEEVIKELEYMIYNVKKLSTK